MPTRESVRQLLSDLLARKVNVQRSAVPLQVFQYSADLIDDEDVLLAICALDLPLSAYMGSALCQVPVGAAKECLKLGKLPPNLQENLREVVNILSSVFNGEGMPHVRLKELWPTATEPFKELNNHLTRATERYDLDVTIEGYGAGKMLLAVVR